MTSNEEFLNCVFCKESFANKEELQVHFRKHGDPKFNESVKNRVSNESDACGDKDADADSVNCDVCSDTFPSIAKAITHKHKVHPDHDAKYFCPWCGKLFTMKHLYNKHVESSHSSKMKYEGNGFHCDYCEADFFAPSAMVYHNKFFHRQDTELAAIGQSRKLKLFEQEMLPLYYCPFCGDEYFNKVNLHKHMGDDHSDENQSPDDVLRCPLCEAIFYHLDAYELHLTFHSMEDTYSEENEIVKNITEFSLEAVPPIMEKVENETTADSETTMNSMGIGEFLQLGMDETVDNRPGEKRKKKKKHKKSKKSAITLDEFFNMNKDVFGEDIDVEGIEEVPTRVVAKRLKTRPQKPKLSANVMPSKEIEKLKKQGIVIKKKSGNVPKFNSSIKGALVGKPINISQNCIADKVTTDETKSISTGDVLSKLLSQSNSQLKIVKKPLLQASKSDLKEQSLDNPSSANEEASSENNINESDLSKFKEHGDENAVRTLEKSNYENGEMKIINENTLKSNLSPDSFKTVEENDKVLETHKGKEVKNKHEHTEHVDKVNRQSQEETFCTSETVNNKVEESAENRTCIYNLDACQENTNLNEKEENLNDTTKKPLDALKKLSHLTVKSLNQPKISTISPTITENQGCEVPDTDEPVKLRTDNSINIKEPLPKPKDDKNLEALKLLNKTITIKSPNKPVQADEHFNDKNQNAIDKLKTSDSINKEAQLNKPRDDKNLETLKMLGKNITIKSTSKPVQADEHFSDKNQNEIDKLKTSDSINKEAQLNKPRDDKNLETLKMLGKNITIKSSNIPVKADEYCSDKNKDKDEIDKFKTNESLNKESQLNKPRDDDNLETLKMLGKNITIKSSNRPVQADDLLHSNNNKDEDVTDKLETDDSIIKEAQSNKPCDDKNLEALQLLSKNITIKSSNQIMQAHSGIDQGKDGKYRTNYSVNKQELLQKPKDDMNLDVLKQLSKTITIKSQNQPVQANKYSSSDIQQESNVNQRHDTAVNKNLRNSVSGKINSNFKSAVTCSQVADNLILKNPSINSSKINNALVVKETKESSDLSVKQQPVITQQLKQLSNVAAKPVSKTHQQITTAVSKSSNVIFSKEGTRIQSSIKIEESKGIETFNIYDSDDEDEMRESSSISNNASIKTSLKHPNSHHSEKLKSLGEQVTTTSRNQQNLVNSSSHCNSYKKYDYDDFDDCDELSYDTQNDRVSKDEQCNTKDSIDHKNFVLQNKLKKLGQHITVTSRNSSPKQIKINRDMEHDSDTEVGPAKVKITELSDNFSDDEFDEYQDGQPSSCIVTSPQEFSENEDNYKNYEEDIEAQLKSTTLQKPAHKIPYSNNSPLNNLQNFSKDITIKSMGNKNYIHSEDEYEPTREINSKIANTTEELSLKHQPHILSKQADRSVNQMAKPSDLEQNTANTEVIVKKFGTKTVIEEITTTVTKTIRTVNQTVQKEVINSSQIISPSTKSQKIQNMMPRQQVYEGKQIRQASPTIGTRVRSVTPQVRPSIRPTKQIVSVRPGLNIRPSNPRMTAVNKPACTITSNAKQPVLGKPLKISPNVFSSSNKRPTTEDLNGPFSCFKKQKESLIPIGDLPETIQGGTTILNTSSHMSKSHVSNTTKIMTGNSMMTSSQVKSEFCSSSEQFSRLATVSGLKIVKTSSAQQASKLEECKISNPKQKNALDAIERLKKQGLLIKKPRLENNYSVHSNCDDNFE